MNDYIVKWKDVQENLESHKEIHRAEVFKNCSHRDNGVVVYNDARVETIFIPYDALYSITTRGRQDE